MTRCENSAGQSCAKRGSSVAALREEICTLDMVVAIDVFSKAFPELNWALNTGRKGGDGGKCRFDEAACSGIQKLGYSQFAGRSA